MTASFSQSVQCHRAWSVIRIRPMFFLLLLVLGCASGCGMLDPQPRSLPDYDNSDGYVLDLKIGDQYETKVPLFLTRLGLGSYSVSQPGRGAPSLKQYSDAPGKFKHIVKLLPTGTVLKLVGLKDGGLQTLGTYVTLDGSDQWIGVCLTEYTKVGVKCHQRYRRDLFKKLGTESDAVQGRSTPD